MPRKLRITSVPGMWTRQPGIMACQPFALDNHGGIDQNADHVGREAPQQEGRYRGRGLQRGAWEVARVLVVWPRPIARKSAQP
jgi:hypothetical protein